MAWTAPRTWTTGELVTAAIMNTHIRDNQNIINPTGVSFIIDGGGAELLTGSQIMWPVPWSFTVDRWDIMCDVVGEVAFEIYAVSNGSWPAAGDSINSGSPAFTTSSACGTDSSPSAWGAVTKGEQALFLVSSVSGVTKATLTLYLNRT